MAATGTPTPNIGLRIPLGTDPASVDDINYNSNLIDTKLGAVGNDSVQDQIDDLNSKINSKTQWTMLAEVTQSANSSIDQTVSVSYPSNATEVMFTIQRLSNGRTIASTIAAKAQFNGGALYAFGAVSLDTASIQYMTAYAVNAVCIDAGNNSVEIAANAGLEGFKYRFFAR